MACSVLFSPISPDSGLFPPSESEASPPPLAELSVGAPPPLRDVESLDGEPVDTGVFDEFPSDVSPWVVSPWVVSPGVVSPSEVRPVVVLLLVPNAIPVCEEGSEGESGGVRLESEGRRVGAIDRS